MTDRPRSRTVPRNNHENNQPRNPKTNRKYSHQEILRRQSAKNFSMSKQEAEDYGACEETSLREEDKDKLFEDFALDCFTRPSFSNNGERL